MRLDRFLAETTELTRSLAKKALQRGEVTLNGVVTKQAATKVGEDDRVEWDGKPLALVGLRYVMLHKPTEVECSARRGLYPRAVDLIELPKAERLQTVGRLDVDTTGLVLLTDDGQWAHRVTSPRRRCAKVYRATLAEPLTGDALRAAIARFEEGLLLDGEEKPTLPAELVMRSDRDAELTLYEGRYHQVKRMFAAIGNHVTALHRESVGPLTLGSLGPGQWRELRPDEVAAFD
ncbi:pseudouridine synthase [Billgrantia desiderata]|uniref:Pseudouridine synthase n=1 Tax=Billgrantia desiderata TaxID=52021 RepID=A0AAW4YRB8_9GAMM|nr:pseudouridine synthase [Halomonas desiderata]MCE8027294.1 pseudouridine synthase [Halomonas desiderata]MCE8040961.1 pseudouridine synthase [Halomonas desiderata]MCE8045536.1 pseudouridine synthase [Halomonas desiderata]MCE8050938.1 pseudouridine synthase [Halomonas desiderata]NIC37738.1 pseudouridine synthase [Halomonas desiderata]